MNFKKYIFRSIAFIAVLTMTGATLSSCIDENLVDCPDSPGISPDESKLYLNINVSLPTAGDTRSTTTNPDGSSSDGTYEAFEEENTINYLTMFLCYQETVEGVSSDKYISLQASSPQYVFQGSRSQTVSVEVKPEDLLKIAGKTAVKVYIVANYNKLGYNPALNTEEESSEVAETFNPATVKALYTDARADWFKFGKNIDYQTISNAEEFTVDFSNITPEMVEAFIAGTGVNLTEEEHKSFELLAFNIKSILANIFSNKTLKMERIFARLDYADGSENRDRLYAMVNDDKDECPFFLEMVSLQPINVAKDFYLFRHTAAGDKDGAFYDDPDGFNTQLFGNEKTDPTFGATSTYTWIYDSDAEYKRTQAKGTALTNLDRHFFNRLLVSGTIAEPFINAVNVSTLTPSNSNYSGYTMEDGDFTYYPICYLGENTLPSTEAMIRGLSTGVVFRTKLCGKDGKALTPETAALLAAELEKEEDKPEATDEDEDENEDDETETKEIYSYSLKVNEDDSITIGVDEDERTISYTSDGDNSGYYLTYYYFVRHNWDYSSSSTHETGKMDPMQFAVVRNNLYRIKVAGFNGLPTPYDPFDPDEMPLTPAIAVDIKVLPWVKRSIEVTW